MSPSMVDASNTPQRFVFLLLEHFSMIAFASAIEPLRIANRITGKPLYEWTLASENGESATCSNLTDVTTNMGLDAINRDQNIVVCGGMDVRTATTKPILSWLRREARKGMQIGGICTGTHTLALAGLVEEKTCTIHWENRDSFAEEFPDVNLTHSIFAIDGNRFTAAGGTAPTDMMLKMIANTHGSDVASSVADQMIYTAIRTESDEQRLSILTRIGVRHPKLATVIKLMEENIEEPVSPSILASDVGMSTRQLERLFRRYMNRSPKRYYMELRLKKARNLLLQTDMSVINVALACGFASPSHFSKCYRASFQTTPYRERGANVNPPVEGQQAT